MASTRRELFRKLIGGAGAAGAGVMRPWLPPATAATAGAAGQGPPPASTKTDQELARQIQADLNQHASFGDKFSGGPGDRATADWVAGRLRGSGYRVEESDFDAPFFVQRTARLTIGPAPFDVVPQAPVVVTGPAGVTARLALVDGAAQGDAIGDVSQLAHVRDRIAVIVTPFARHAALFPTRGIGLTVTTAVKAGASAVVLITTGPSREAVALNAPEAPFVSVPMAVLAPKIADPVVAAARAGDDATLVLDGEATHRPSRNVAGWVERGPRWLAISTPRSGWYGCVVERGTGTAAFLELADWAVRRFPELSVFVMSTGGHEYFFAGSHRLMDALAKRGAAPPPANTIVWTHVGATLAARDATESPDGTIVMLDAADPQRSLMATESAQEAAAEAFRGLSGLERPGLVRPGAGELSSFTDRGYTTAFATIGVHRWFHTREDTLERADARLVVPVLHAHQRTIERLVSHG